MVRKRPRAQRLDFDKKYHNCYDNFTKKTTFAEKNEAMRVLMNRDLLDLYESGRSKAYKDVARNSELMEGFSSVRLSNRYVHRLIFKETDDGLQVEIIDINDTHYGNKR